MLPVLEVEMQKLIKLNYLNCFFLVCLAGTIWSFGALIVRYMTEAQHYQWQYLFFRGLTIAVVLSTYLLAKEGVTFIKNFKRNGFSIFLGACGLVAAFSGFIWSITLTTAANTLFMLAASPFIAAFFGILLLRENVRSVTWVAMVIAVFGILIMVAEGLEADHLLGNLIALISAFGFAVFSVSLRWRKETPQFTTIALAGLLCALLTLIIVFFGNDTLVMPLRNIYLSVLHGFIVGFGLILFVLGAKFLPAAELALLSLVEVVGGVLWVYLPIFGIHEVPSALSLVGGSVVLFAIVLDGMGMRRRRQMIRVDTR